MSVTVILLKFGFNRSGNKTIPVNVTSLPLQVSTEQGKTRADIERVQTEEKLIKKTVQS